MDAIVKLQNVNKVYKGVTKGTKALKDCSLEVKPSSFTSIIGKSGCGKSTLLNAIGGLIEVDSGSICVKGTELTTMTRGERAAFRRNHIGFIFQFFNLLQELTVLENLMIPFDLNQQRVDKEFMDGVLQYLELQDVLKKFPYELSGGEQQRVSIARAIIRKPSIILADEPTGNLDRKNAKQVVSLLRECQRLYSQTIIMVTHDMDLAKKADTMQYMEDGQVMSYETT
ncbi:ABC transporter ATP-binding protein [Faecalicoccus acidiformans]|uniref:ABC transporter ATP-binding protein n=1 Tax=Faecalicoccus acidiformans TaxID=915173 RepID=A0ABS2FPH7_9FIRM|nr:ABC transporter ATP-binding protein [Faecalicoccus acidiformans]MBM6831948.1 ABC transporter ATP-binding protein [Faecalicoccus acidiformans]